MLLGVPVPDVGVKLIYIHCWGCVADYNLWKQLKVIPEEEISDAQQQAQDKDDDWEREGSDHPDLAIDLELIAENKKNKENWNEGWGTINQDEVHDEWPSYTSQVIADMDSPPIKASKSEEKNDSYVLVIENQQKQLDHFLNENQHLFASKHKDLLETNVIIHNIDK